MWWQPEQAQLETAFTPDPKGDDNAVFVTVAAARRSRARVGDRSNVRGRREPSVAFSGRLEKVNTVSGALSAVLGLDLSDPKAILDYVRRYGPMNVSRFVLENGTAGGGTIERGIVTDTGVIYARGNEASGAVVGSETLSDFRAAAGAIRSLAALRTHLEDWISIAALRVDWPEDCPWESPANKSEAANNCKWAIDEALEYLTVEVQPVWPAGSIEGVARLRWCLYARCVLELLSASHAPRRCARDDCEKVFTKQDRQPEPEPTKRRSDTIYCSVRCGRLVATRKYRQRNRNRTPTGGR